MTDVEGWGGGWRGRGVASVKLLHQIYIKGRHIMRTCEHFIGHIIVVLLQT